jgi:hypothetical protein
MNPRLDPLRGPLHAALALTALWLIGSSPWLTMFTALPEPAGAFNLAHLILGLAVLPLVLLFLAACTLGGGWRLYFPWVAGDFAQTGRDLAGLVRGERPLSEGGGLFAALEGLLLLAVLAAAATGAAWWLAQGGDAAVSLWQWHKLAARACTALLGLHITAAALHWVDLIRN